MEIRRLRAFTGVVSVVFAGAVLLAGCSSGGDGDEVKPSAGATSATTAAAGGVAAAAPGAEAKTYPVVPSVTAEDVPVIATKENGDWRLSLNEVRRVGDESVVVVGTLFSKQGRALSGFEEPGYLLRRDAEGKTESSYEFSAVTLTVPGEGSTVYQVMRTEAGVCACTQGIAIISKGQYLAVYAYLTAPKDVDKVTITVRGFAPFTDVEVVS